MMETCISDYKSMYNEMVCRCNGLEKDVSNLKSLCTQQRKELEEKDAIIDEQRDELLRYEGQIQAYQYCVRERR